LARAFAAGRPRKNERFAREKNSSMADTNDKRPLVSGYEAAAFSFTHLRKEIN